MKEAIEPIIPDMDSIGETSLAHLGLDKALGSSIALAFVDGGTLHNSTMSLSTKIEKASKTLFDGASEPKEKEPISSTIRDKVTKFTDPISLINHITENIGPSQETHPELVQGLTNSLMGAVNYLGTKLPDTSPRSMLEQSRTPSREEINHFEHHARVVENPLSIFEQIKEGSITSKQIEAMSEVYPVLSAKMRGSLYSELMGHVAKNGADSIPYKTRLGLSAFLGQNLDSSMSVESLIANQAALSQMAGQKAQVENAQRQAIGQMASPTQSGMGRMKIGERDMTRSQTTEMRRGTK